MCGRFTLHAGRDELEATLGVGVPESRVPEYNIGPGRAIWAQRAPEALTAVHWGKQGTKNLIINGRLETADRLPHFREAWARHRCLVPASGFFEWKSAGDRKHPFLLHPPDAPLMLLAGLVFPHAGETGQPPPCVILTTEANADVSDIHGRMPVALPPRDRDAWLDGAFGKSDVAERAAAARFERRPLTARVNSVRNNDPEVLREDEPPPEQPALF